MDGVDEKLTPAGVFGAGICHRQSPGSFEIFAVSSSGMQPSLASRVISSFVARFVNFEFGGGPPMPAFAAPFFFEFGHPNCNMNPSMTL